MNGADDCAHPFWTWATGCCHGPYLLDKSYSLELAVGFCADCDKPANLKRICNDCLEVIR